MLRFRLFYDKDKETDWLNELSERGYAMTHFFAGIYRFEPCEPGKYRYQVDFGKGFFHVPDDYREFMAEMNVEIVQTWGPWVIVRREAAQGAFELYTDLDSELAHYIGIRRFFRAGLVVELICFFLEVIGAARGYYPAMVMACLLGLAVAGFADAILRMNERVAELKERRGETVRCRMRKGVSGLVHAGLLLNSAVILCFGSETPSGPLHTIRLTLEMIALLAMAAGLFVTCRGKRRIKNADL